MPGSISVQNEELQGRVAQLRVDNEELRSMISDRETSILELQLNNDMLTARLALCPDYSQQVCSVVSKHSAFKMAYSLVVETVQSRKLASFKVLCCKTSTSGRGGFRCELVLSSQCEIEQRTHSAS
jgi:hypothetical protein